MKKTKEANEKKKKKQLGCATTLFAILIILMIWVMTMPPQDKELPPYTLVNSSDYVREERLCQGYRVVADPSITDEEIFMIYNEITDDDDYLYHTIWFYENEKDMVIPFATLDDEIQIKGNPSIER